MKVSIIGTGNVATQLALGLEYHGFSIDEIYGRHNHTLRALVQKLYVADAKTDLDFSESPASIIFICVADDAIASVSSQIILPKDTILVHTSGSVPIGVLSSHHKQVGVFYPLQSISKTKVLDWAGVPLILNASSDSALKVLYSIARKLSDKVYEYDDNQRKALHLAAVFGSNFTNHLLKIVKDISDAENLDFQMFRGLVLNTVQKAFDIGPEQGQTGPAIRNDQKTMQKHFDMLQGSQDLDKIYELLSRHIQQTYKA